MSTNISLYIVIIDPFSKRHFIKDFERKHCEHWTITLRSIENMLERVDTLRNTDRAEIICSNEHRHIIKGNFAVAWRKESPKASGNRYIVFVDDTSKECHVLLVYSKNDIKGDHETVWWKSLLKQNFSEICQDFSL